MRREGGPPGVAAGRREVLAELLARLRDFPHGAAVKSPEQLRIALQSRPGVIFILRADGLELAPVVRSVHAAGKLAAVHLDLIDGVAQDTSGVRWLARCGADAVISSHGRTVRAVEAAGLVTIQRVLCASRTALELGLAAVARAQPEIVEVLPGVVLPDLADLILPRLAVPLLAGGFIREARDVRRVLAAGALAVTTSQPELWR